jgi:NADP-dependent 3-hydroxy acid dehydrogenase YdfG
MQTLKDKVLILTGAGGTIAGAVAESFAKEGAQLLLVDRDAVRIEGRASSYGTRPIVADLGSLESAQSIVAIAKERWGKVDGLIHLVGDVIAGNILKASSDDYSRVFDSNVRTLFYATKAVLPELMKREEGFIAGIASREAMQGGAEGVSLFAAAKSAVAAFLRSLDQELESTKINVAIAYPLAPVDSLSNRKMISNKRKLIHPSAIGYALVQAALSGQGGRLLELPIYPPR